MVQVSPYVRRREKQQWFITPTKDHLAHFYAQDWMLTTCLLDYVSEGLCRGERCIVAATPQVLIRLQKGLRELGIDVAAALQDGQYITYDAEETLARVMDGRAINVAAFEREVGEVLSRLAMDPDRPIRMYGEMVSVLLRQHNISAALDLEAQWERLRQMYNISLYCAYPESALTNIASSSALESLSHAHSLCIHSCVSQGVM